MTEIDTRKSSAPRVPPVAAEAFDELAEEGGFSLWRPRGWRNDLRLREVVNRERPSRRHRRCGQEQFGRRLGEGRRHALSRDDPPRLLTFTHT